MLQRGLHVLLTLRFLLCVGTFILFSLKFSAISSSTKTKRLGCNVDDVLNDYLQYIFALFVHDLAKLVSFFHLFLILSLSCNFLISITQSSTQSIYIYISTQKMIMLTEEVSQNFFSVLFKRQKMLELRFTRSKQQGKIPLHEGLFHLFLSLVFLHHSQQTSS